MLKELRNVDDIEEYFSKLDDKGLGRIHRSRIYTMAYEQQQLDIKKQPLLDRFNDKSYCTVEEVYILNDDYQFVKTRRKETGEILYHIFVNYKPINECASSFDSAVLSAIAYRQTKNTLPALYMAKIIDYKDSPQYE